MNASDIICLLIRRKRPLSAAVSSRGEPYDECKAVLKKKIAEKQHEYDNLMKNLSSGTLPAQVVSDIGNRMNEIKDEITCLENTQPPKDFTIDTVRAWLESLKANPDEKAMHLLIERIDVDQSKDKEKTDISIHSTLTSVLGNHGGDRGARTHDLSDVNRTL